MVQGGDGPGLGEEPLQRGRVAGRPAAETIFRATRRFMVTCSARNTLPMPPRPNSSISLYLPRKKEARPASNWAACQRVKIPCRARLRAKAWLSGSLVADCWAWANCSAVSRLLFSSAAARRLVRRHEFHSASLALWGDDCKPPATPAASTSGLNSSTDWPSALAASTASR